MGWVIFIGIIGLIIGLVMYQNKRADKFFEEFAVLNKEKESAIFMLSREHMIGFNIEKKRFELYYIHGKIDWFNFSQTAFTIKKIKKISLTNETQVFTKSVSSVKMISKEFIENEVMSSDYIIVTFGDGSDMKVYVSKQFGYLDKVPAEKLNSNFQDFYFKFSDKVEKKKKNKKNEKSLDEEETA